MIIKKNYYSILSFRTYQIIQFEFLKDKNIIKTNFQKQKLMFRFFKYLNGIHFIYSKLLKKKFISFLLVNFHL